MYTSFTMSGIIHGNVKPDGAFEPGRTWQDRHLHCICATKDLFEKYDSRSQNEGESRSRSLL